MECNVSPIVNSEGQQHVSSVVKSEGQHHVSSIEINAWKKLLKKHDLSNYVLGKWNWWCSGKFNKACWVFAEN